VANKKRRRRRPPAKATGGLTGEQAPQRQQGISETSAVRRERKEEARQARQTALRRYRRQRMIRRGLVWGGAALAVLLAVYFIGKNSSGGTGKLTSAATRTMTAAGCTDLEKPADQGRTHLPSGGSYTYQQQPPTSGPHDPTPLPAGVYTTAQPETNMVHSLEHGAVEIYYSDAVPQDVVQALSSVAKTSDRAIMTPAPQTLSPPIESGKSFTSALAFAAWDRLVQCPSTVTAAQAKTIAQAWITAFVNADSAPEHGFAL